MKGKLEELLFVRALNINMLVAWVNWILPVEIHCWIADVLTKKVPCQGFHVCAMTLNAATKKQQLTILREFSWPYPTICQTLGFSNYR